ncbi:GNAT family N-acetyltransferase [Bacillus sp. FJAT-49736]|uniref:GNAT family N-acetyltransferase n=1 Tax=Bacillus sp. FJAT-49736 TaxID=2833582 RepID=UPI001BC9B890|nr:GNAT family N-acetyltransferase [Bacillus sp. FJAT-49736]MBS4172231.1 GNAT family N-acetyltransferase [Bacillus sp. FJAT-49736]
MDLTNITRLSGNRVCLLPMEEIHAEELYSAGNNPRIWKYTQGYIASIEDAKSYIHHALAAENTIPFVIYDKISKKIVGSTRLYNISESNRSLEIGATWLSPMVWRTHVNTECKYLLLKYCFEELKTIRVQFKADLRNIRSQLAIERIGGVKEGILRNHMILPDGYIRDTVYYSIIDSEWSMIKNKIQDYSLL